MARFYANENFPMPAAEALRRLGHDVLTTQETGLSGRAAPDEEVLAFAHSQGRALLTLNRKHFARLHQQTPDHSGLVVCTFDPDFARQANRIHAVVEERPLAAHLLRINRPQS